MRKIGIIIGCVALFLLGVAYKDHQNIAVAPASFTSATGAATAGTATATYSAVAGTRFVMKGVVATCGAVTSAADLVLKDGSTTKATFKVMAASFIYFFDAPLTGSINTDMVATLSTCGAGVEGRVTFFGYPVFEVSPALP